MELQDLIIVIFMTLCGIGALVLVLLQKKGIIKPVLTQNVNGPVFMSGGMILLFATAMGAYRMLAMFLGMRDDVVTGDEI